MKSAEVFRAVGVEQYRLERKGEGGYREGVRGRNMTGLSFGRGRKAQTTSTRKGPERKSQTGKKSEKKWTSARVIYRTGRYRQPKRKGSKKVEGYKRPWKGGYGPGTIKRSRPGGEGESNGTSLRGENPIGRLARECGLGD